MRVAVIGAGYVGVVQAAGLAHLGHRVSLSDVDARRIESLRRGESPIFEHGLDDLLRRGIEHGLLSFHTDNIEALKGSRIVFLALPTPQGDTGHADLSFIDAVIDEIGPHLGDGTIIVTKSTVPVGTARRLQDRLTGMGSGAQMVSNPEFLREGSAVDDFLRAERVVVGSDDPAAAETVARLYEGLGTVVVTTDPMSAELTKYAANAYLATRLTFVNSIANLAEELGADIEDVMRAMGLDRRIGPHFLQPGPGYGGSCFPKDTAALVALSADAGYDLRLVQTAIEVNEHQRDRIVDRIGAILGGDLEGAVVAMWGIAFKAGTDDVRESPAVDLARRLAARGAKVVAHDPEASVPDVHAVDEPLAAVDGADVLLVATEWPAYLQVDLAAVAQLMRGSAVFDARNLLEPDQVASAGLDYHGLGRRSRLSTV